eukprot:358727-Chlamydomonas_euryale.AAC.8
MRTRSQGGEPERVAACSSVRETGVFCVPRGRSRCSSSAPPKSALIHWLVTSRGACALLPPRCIVAIDSAWAMLSRAEQVVCGVSVGNGPAYTVGSSGSGLGGVCGRGALGKVVCTVCLDVSLRPPDAAAAQPRCNCTANHRSPCSGSCSKCSQHLLQLPLQG